MAVWCDLHELVRHRQGGKGGRAHTSSSFKEELNFDYAEYEVGRCRPTLSNPELKARLVSALETKM